MATKGANDIQKYSLGVPHLGCVRSLDLILKFRYCIISEGLDYVPSYF